MTYVICPCCDSRVEVARPAWEPDRNRISSVVVCELCDMSFDCAYKAVEEDQQADGAAG